MRLHLLGPLELWAAGRRFDLGQPRQRTVLAALAADAGRLVTVEHLVDRTWDDAAPNGARSALYAHISRLRRILHEAADAQSGGGADPSSPAPGAPLSIERASGGYVLKADEDTIDLTSFRALVSQARSAPVEDTDRGRLLADALELWRGVPFSGLPGSWAERMRTIWTQECLEATVAWAYTELRLGRPENVTARVRPMLAEHPLAEPLAVVVIRALAASGRTAEALGTYADVREQLGQALGVDPGDELRAVHQELLRAGTDARPVRAPHSHPPRPTPTALRLPRNYRRTYADSPEGNRNSPNSRGI